MKLHLEISTNYVTTAEMKDGQIGVIRKWFNSERIGLIVQKCGDSLILLGLPHSQSYPLCSIYSDPTKCIEILPPGTLLEI